MNIGDILITRNADEKDNQSPGYWNHVSIFVGGDNIVEAQSAPWSTIKLSEVDEFFNRYPKIQIYRWKDDDTVGEKAATYARTMLGKEYKWLASLFYMFRRGENCVTTVRKAYKEALGFDPGWRKPDDITTDKRLVFITEKNSEEDNGHI